ncbi:hypothetical protein MtrunA17_Chr2g0323741 [Medicago truncatula]|uniref:DUF3774 domain protein n=1 Tax=Medicago truncatula TaxID=3880 RepID=I3S705_MEDTR|nr:unknown [Medicago truncatula]KEH39062.1 DUF3774 domain protein [Medicago truncatula]RHN75668.1 hypothetical protein MtrunA17_Chr2g0323741 [Medicago truncatula]
MSYLNRVWMAATVAVAQGHTDPIYKCKTALGTIHQNRTRLFSAGGALSALLPLSSVVVSDATVSSKVEEKLRQTDDSLQKVMYMNCWGQG